MVKLEQRLVDLARAATGDSTITSAGDFLPKGTTLRTGGFGGQTIGRGMSMAIAPQLNPGGEEAAALVGLVGDRRLLADQLANPVIIVAASPTQFHLLITEGAMHGPTRTEQLQLAVTLDRSDTTVKTGQRASVRILELSERSTGRRFALEGKRLGKHTNRPLITAATSSEPGAASPD
jgi:hypothetical protein